MKSDCVGGRDFLKCGLMGGSMGDANMKIPLRCWKPTEAYIGELTTLVVADRKAAPY